MKTGKQTSHPTEREFPLETTSAEASRDLSAASQMALSAREGLRAVLRGRTASVGLIICLVVGLVAIFAPVIAPYPPHAQELRNGFARPSLEHPLGTDEFGRDVFSRIVWGSRVSVRLGILAVAGALVMGVPFGLVAGYFGGRTETVIMRVTDIFLAFPVVLLAMAIVAFLGFSIGNIILAIGVALAPYYVRLVRSSVLSVKEREFIRAAIAVGASHIRIIVRHLMPNVLAPIIVMSTLNVAWAILVESGLSFLGLGVPPPTATWGSIIGDGRGYLRNAPWISTFSGLAITVTALGLNLLGDGLRDALDPTIRRRP